MSGIEQGYKHSKLLRSNSAYAVSNGQGGYSLTNWISDLGTTCQQVNRVSIVSCVFTNNGYNVNGPTSTDPNYIASYNQNYMDEAFNHIQISEGFYNVTQLMSVFQAAIAPQMINGQTFTFTQNPYSGKISFTWTHGGEPITTFTLISNYDVNVNVRSLWELLGFTIGQVATTGVPLEATNLPRLTGLRQVYLTSSALAPANQIDEKGDFQNVCVNIPISAPFGSVNVWECKVDSHCQITYLKPRNLQRVDFQLRDEDGSIIDLHGSSVKVELKVWFNKAS